MDFKQAVVTCVKDKYCNFDGRAPRSEYWWFQVFHWIVVTAAAVVGEMVSPQAGAGLSGLAGLALFLPNLGVSVRRLHDRNLSGWWMLLILIPFLGALVLFIFFVQKSIPAYLPRYGADPLGGDASGSQAGRMGPPASQF